MNLMDKFHNKGELRVIENKVYVVRYRPKGASRDNKGIFSHEEAAKAFMEKTKQDEPESISLQEMSQEEAFASDSGNNHERNQWVRALIENLTRAHGTSEERDDER